MALEALGRTLLIIGLLIVALGLALLFGHRIPFLGRLPGDIVIQRDNVSCFLPLATMLVLSVLLSLVLTIVSLLMRR